VAIVLSCECGRKLQIADEFAGQEGQCPSCGRMMLIPAGDEPPPPPNKPLYDVVEAPSPSPQPPTPAPEAVTDGQAPPRESGAPITNHGGGPLARNADFFVDPPAEIGPVLSANTTLVVGKRPWTGGARMITAGISGLFGLGLGAIVVGAASPAWEFWHFFWPTLGSVLGLALAFWRTQFSHTCTYVGREGVARFRCKGSRNRITASELFRFRDALELRTSQTVRYYNGAYVGTDYAFTWSDVGGRTRYAISGKYNNAKGLPVPTDPYHYGGAAEVAWTVYLLGQVSRQIELAGSIAFNLKGAQSVRLGPQSLTAQLGGEPVEWAAEDIDAVIVDKGMVKIKRTDAKEGWFSATGVIKFPYNTLANARLFLHLMNNLLGVRIN
jgi:hypothetical protein